MHTKICVLALLFLCAVTLFLFVSCPTEIQTDFIVTFDTTGGSEISPTSKIVTCGLACGELPTPTQQWHTFGGWWTEVNGAGTRITADTIISVTTDITLYAKWDLDITTGPAGGILFYENPNWIEDGWRYLEAAPFGWYNDSLDPANISGANGIIIPATETAVGSGESNTSSIVHFYSPFTGDTTVAAKECADFSLIHEGRVYDDWFLPSAEELELVYTVLVDNNLGGFSTADGYLSSSEYDADEIWARSMSTGNAYRALKSHYARFRPIRAFW
jgi:hypothetical protein